MKIVRGKMKITKIKIAKWGTPIYIVYSLHKTAGKLGSGSLTKNY
jgi:hypothetical protein